MNNSFKITTLVFKIVTFAIIATSFALGIARASASDFDRKSFRSVRKGLWYAGIEEGQTSLEGQIIDLKDAQFDEAGELPEELSRALDIELERNLPI